ncbi:hypothetical protein GCM10008969_01890 [Pseudomonas veronii subsp. inensis]
MITSAPSTQIRAALGDQSQDQEEADAMELRQIDTDQLIERIRSMNHIYRQTTASFTVESPASSSTAKALRNPLPTAHVAASPVRGAATYRAPGR